MFAGHFGLAAIVKSRRPEVPLWSLLVAGQALDIVFLPLNALGVETMQAVGAGGYGEQVIHADYTHSLLGALLISAVVGVLTLWKWNRRMGLVLGAMAFSHWILDLVVHRHDMPILPGNLGGLPTLGFGLWSSPTISIALEALMVGAGAILYVRSTLAQTDLESRNHRLGPIALGSLVTLLLVATIAPDALSLG